MTQHILLTGRPGAGKTTVIQKIVRGLQGLRMEGFYTEEFREGKTRKGFRIITLSGMTRVLASADIKSSVRIGRYAVDLQAIEAVINPVIDQALKNADLLIMDEVGKMETASKEFTRLVETAFDSSLTVLATVPVYRLPLAEKLKRRTDVVIFEVTPNNRNRLPLEIMKQVREVIRQPSA